MSDQNELDLREKNRGGATDRRLWVQFQAFTGVPELRPVTDALGRAGLNAVVYADATDPRGVGIATFSEAPDYFVTQWRDVLAGEPFASLTHRPELTMFGRTYAIGYEPDLEESLIARPTRTLTHPDWVWGIWYPLRRKGEFARLDKDEQREILMEHGSIGRDFVEGDYAHDLRLACHGVDRADNDFVIGLFGKELAPLSKIVETMRSTVQTSTYLEKLGPFFVGKKVG